LESRNDVSKAFTRESDDLPEEQPLPRQSPALPPGAKNYLTPGGARRLQEELDRLIAVERPRAAASPDDTEARRELQMLDQRIRHLQQSLQSATMVPPPVRPWDQVRFGATVTVRDRSGAESNYRIVGIDETDLDRNWVSWLSPIARALINARLGQRVRFRFPAGEEELEIVRITYE
jgi:transcription elongation factor GreB